MPLKGWDIYYSKPNEYDRMMCNVCDEPMNVKKGSNRINQFCRSYSW